MHISFVLLEMTGFLSLVIASINNARIKCYVDIMHISFVLLEITGFLSLEITSIIFWDFLLDGAYIKERKLD